MGAIKTENFARLEISAAQELWHWLDENHRQDESIWLVTFKKHHASRFVGRDEVLDALIAYGWIDGIRRAVDVDRTMQLISKRRVQHWSASYKERASRLSAEGLMQAPGLESIKAGKENGLWDYMADVDALIWPDDLKEALQSDAKAQSYFDTCPPAYMRNVLRWIKLAKTAPTRAKRIATVVSTCAMNERIAQM